MWNVALRGTAWQLRRAELQRRMQSLRTMEPVIWLQRYINPRVRAFMLKTGVLSLTRKQKFAFGAALALWPLLMLALVPSEVLINRNSTVCTLALLSEAVASVLFFYLRRRRKDRLAFWSTIAAAVAGEVTLAFLVAAVAIIMRGQ